MMKPLSIYIHIPFCNSKCYYCDFLSAPATSEQEVAAYIKALLWEIEVESTAYHEYSVRTVFIGGGTPSVLPVEDIEAILCKLREVFNFPSLIETSEKKLPLTSLYGLKEEIVEITIEVNPKTITDDILSQYKKAGINRLSIGLQSTKNDELKLLGRSHTFEDYLSTYEKARNAGFENINVDLISNIPNQSLKSWQDNLAQIVNMKPEHISAYSLIIEKGTPFHNNYMRYDSETAQIAEEEKELAMYHYTRSFLEDNNYICYEISNYAKRDNFDENRNEKSKYECRHNITYWERGNYVGFGLGASSMVDNKRWTNISDLKSYIMIYLYGESLHNAEILSKKIKKSVMKLADEKLDGKNGSSNKYLEIKKRGFYSKVNNENHFYSAKNKLQVLSLKEQMEEYMFLGLRLTKGVRVSHFNEVFGLDINEVYGSILLSLKEKNLITIREYIALTPFGVDLSNYVMAHFLLD